MLRRKPSKVDVKVEDKEELEEARKRTAAAAPKPLPTNTNTTASIVLQQIDQSKDTSSKAQRIGLIK